MAESKGFVLKFSLEEVRLLRYWRESCHLYNVLCPLHCIKEGTDFCHLVAEHINQQMKEQKEETEITREAIEKVEQKDG